MSAFQGADVDGLDKVAKDCQEAAQVCDEVRAALEIIVAASWCFGPFGAAFTSYLKTVVIPWLQRVSQALQLFARVLSAHSNAQRNASSAATSLPDYTTPALPSGNTWDYPTLPSGVTTTAAGNTAATIPASTVTAPPSVAGTSDSLQPASPQPTGSETVQEITALTGLLGAVARLTNPGQAAAMSTLTPTAMSTLTPTDTPTVTPTAAPLGGELPAAIGQQQAMPTSDGGFSGGSGSGGGFSGGGGGGGIPSSGGDFGTAPTTPITQPSTPIATSAPQIAPTVAHETMNSAAPQTTAHASASHDGLYSGLGQATGLGAGLGAVAKASIAEARRRATDALLDATSLPFDASADGATQAQILSGELAR